VVTTSPVLQTILVLLLTLINVSHERPPFKNGDRKEKVLH